MIKLSDLIHSHFGARRCIIGLLLLCCAPPATSSAQQTFTLPLWPDKPAYASSDPTDTATLTVFLPDKEKATGRAVIICPGGGYSHLSMQKEGTDWAPFFNGLGIAVAVLKYRMPHGNYNVPISDAREALKTVRRNAAQWNINADDVGIMGFSAGGHLASTIATHGEQQELPDFQILFYPVITMMPDITHQGSHDNLLGKGAKKKLEIEYSNDTRVSRMTPRAWIALCDDDQAVLPANGVNYYLELYKHDIPSSLHVYPDGGHGWGFLYSFKYHIELLLELKAWLYSF